MKSLIATLSAAAMMAGVASAQLSNPTTGPVSNPTGVVASVSFADIQPVLRDAGFATEIVNINGESVLRVGALGKTLLLSQKACQSETKCAGLWMFAFLNDSRPLETLNAFNQASRPARATVANGKVLLDRYLIADYGTTRGSLVINVGVFASMVDQYFQYMQQSGPVAVSFEPLLDMPAAPGTSTIDHQDLEFLRVMSTDPMIYNYDVTYEGKLN